MVRDKTGTRSRDVSVSISTETRQIIRLSETRTSFLLFFFHPRRNALSFSLYGFVIVTRSARRLACACVARVR